MSSQLIDLGLVVVIFLSLLIGAYRGFVQSFLSVISWAVAAWVTWNYGGLAEPLLDGWNLTPAMQAIAAHLGVFFFVLFLMSVIGYAIAKAVSSDGFSSVDRTLGAAFGIVRGVVIVLLLAVGVAYALGVDQPLWQESIALPLLEPWVKDVQQVIAQVGGV